MHVIKRITALVAVLFLLAPVFSLAEDQSDAVYTELGNYLLYYDRLLEDALFAIGYVEKFNESRTQDDLMIARCAVQSALREIRNMELPEMSMTDDEYFEYMLKGVEIESLALLYENLSVVRDEKIRFLLNLTHDMTADIYFEPALDNLIQQLALYRQNIWHDARDLVYMANYLLNQIGGDMSQKFWDVIIRDSVVIKDEMDVFYTSQEELARLTSENLDLLSENIDALQSLSEGFDEYFYNVTLEAAEAGDVSVFKNNRTDIIGETQVFPMPEWRLPSEMNYTYIFSEPETGDLYVHSMGNEITSAPDRVKITIDDITIDEISEYVDSLSILEYNPVYEFETEDDEITLYVMAEKGESTLMIIWNERETILYLMPPAASFVPYMYWK